MKTNFFQALFGTCAGMTVFEKLKEQGLGRALAHLLLMSLICGIILACGFYPTLKRSLRAVVAVVVENCGSIICSHDRIEPGINPEKSRSFVINGPFSVTYLPAKAVDLPSNFQQDCSSGLLWSADCKFLLWKKLSNDKFGVVPIWDPLGSTAETVVSGNVALLAELHKAEPVKLNLPTGKKEEFTPEKLQALTDLALIAMSAGYMLRKTLLEVIIYIMMFVVVTKIMDLTRRKRMPFKELTVLAIYAGFPPMLIGSVAEALNLPYLSFNMIYVLGMTLYLVMVMNRLERLQQEKQWSKEGQ